MTTTRKAAGGPPATKIGLTKVSVNKAKQDDEQCNDNVDADNSDDQGDGPDEDTGNSQLSSPITDAKQSQRVFIDKLLGDAKTNARKVSDCLDKAVNAIFDKIEIDCSATALKVNDELDAKINHIKEALKTQDEILKRHRDDDGALRLQTDALKAQLDELTRLGHLYRETAYISGPDSVQQKRDLSLEKHKHRRQTHIRTLSCRAAAIVMRETNSKLRDEQIRVNTLTFVKAHRDLFTTIERSTQACSGGMALINNNLAM